MGPSKKNKVRFNLEKRTNTAREKIIQNADSVGVTNLESSTCSRLPFHSPRSELTFQCTHSTFSPHSRKRDTFLGLQQNVGLKFSTLLTQIGKRNQESSDISDEIKEENFKYLFTMVVSQSRTRQIIRAETKWQNVLYKIKYYY